ncbi:hypothetical protein CVT25_011537 [Psilocybe cyanescens]|uniref:EamA domain-containing protein n=1 Tax=Psilocybe cyanescens TaxID=93625 RepID=A0A409XCC7_PSICY|nr:hypothetical protein CVT25_011537 [Psilocybe cyanescens]
MSASTTNATARTAYAAQTPEYAEFADGPGKGHVERGLPSSSPNPPRTHTRTGTGRPWHARTTALLKSNTGLLLVTGAQVFLSLMNVAVKKLNSVDPPVPTLEIITYICCMGYMLSTGVPDPYFGPKGVRLLLVTRGAVGFFGLFGVYYSLQYLSLSDATVLTFLAPMCTAIAGALLLGEKFTKREAFAGIVSLIGVVLIARPAAIFGEMAHLPQGAGVDGSSGMPSAAPAEKGTPKERLVAVGVALLGVLGATGAYTSIRAIGKRAHPLHSMTFFSAWCVIISAIAMVVNKTPVVVPTQMVWLALLLMIGIFGFVAQTLLTMGLQRETAGRGSMAVYTQIVFATILERIFFHAVPTALSVIGTLLIISSALYVALTKEKDAGEESKSIGMQRVRTTRDAELEEGLLTSSERERELGEREGKGSLEKEERD